MQSPTDNLYCTDDTQSLHIRSPFAICNIMDEQVGNFRLWPWHLTQGAENQVQLPLIVVTYTPSYF